jgi:uncharacterized protein HemY
MNSIPEIKYLKSFVLYTLMAFFVGVVAVAIQGATFGGGLGVLGIDIPTMQIIFGIAGLIFALVFSFFVFRLVIQTLIIPQIAKHYEGHGDEDTRKRKRYIPRG